MGELSGLERNNWIHHLKVKAREELYGYYYGRMMYRRNKLKKFLKKHPFEIQKCLLFNKNPYATWKRYFRIWKSFKNVYLEWLIFSNQDSETVSEDIGREILKIVEEVKHCPPENM